MTELLSLRGSRTKNVAMIIGHDFEGVLPSANMAGIAHSGLRNFRRAGLTVSQTGNGIELVDFASVENIISAQPKDALIIFFAHGTLNAPQHEFDLGTGRIPTQRLFEIISRTGRRMDLVLLSCGAGITHGNAECHLPAGSRMVTLTDRRAILAPDSSKALLSQETIMTAMSAEGLAFDQLILRSLARTAHASSPVITEVGVGTSVLSEMVSAQIGQCPTLAEIRKVRARLQISRLATLKLCRDMQTGSLKVLSSSAPDYGKAIAAAVAMSDDRLPLQRPGRSSSYYPQTIS